MVKEKDRKKIKKILLTLVKTSEGLWVREIARETGIAKSTVHYYIDKVINEIIENIGVKDKSGRYFGVRIIRLKPKIRDTIEKEGLKKVYKFLKISKNSA